MTFVCAPGAREEVGLVQAAALLGAHRAVVEVEVQVADARVLLVGDLAEGVPRRQRRVDRHGDLRRVELGAGEGERPRGRELEERLRRRVAALEVRDPDRAVDGRPADRAGALGDDLSRAAAQRPLVVDAEEMELRALDRVEDPRVALGGADLADHAVGAVATASRSRGRPGSSAGAPGRSRARGGRARAGRRRRRSCPSPPRAPRSRRGGPRGGTGCSCRPRACGRCAWPRPSPASTLAVGLEHRHAPLAHPELDRPVQRRRSAVAPRAGVHDQAAMAGPDRLGDQLLQHRAHDQLRAVLADRRLHRGGRVDHRDRHVVAELGQRDPGALTEAVVRRHEEEDRAMLTPGRVARASAGGRTSGAARRACRHGP